MTVPVLDRYEIRAELGQGGMSVVYRARDKQLPRDVAVKVLHGFLAKQEDARQRFHREAVAVAKLHHPGIVEIFDYSGPDAPDTYIVTELISGLTLRDFFEKHGPFPNPELGALIIAELCRPLAHAHEHGVIHRDLKPENVMVTDEGDLKLMDFGIAQLQDGNKLTLTGTLLGSPAHMAPEVIDGERPDARADVFSLGTMLYWLAVGRLPFSAPNPSALFRRILEGQYEDPQEAEPRIGNGLAKIIRRALEPSRDARYESALALRADLVVELEQVGLVPAEMKVKELLANPKGFGQAMGPEIVGRLLEAARTAARQKNYARALDRVNRILALEPGHVEARLLARSVGNRASLSRTKRLASAALVLLVTLAGVAAAMMTPRPEPAPRPSPVASASPSVSPSEGPRVVASTVAPAVVSALPSPGVELRASARPSQNPSPSPTRAQVPSPRPSASATPSPTAAATPTPTAAPTPTPTPAASETPSPPPPKKAKLAYRIKYSFADVELDGVVIASASYGGTLELAPGRHQLVVKNPRMGAFRPRILEVDAAGHVFDLKPDGRHEATTLDFEIPRPGETPPPDWQPNH